MQQLDELKLELCKTAHRMYEHELVVANDGNLSCRLSDGTFLITPTRMCKGDLTPDDLVVIDKEMRVLQGAKRPSTEMRIHLKIYELRSDVNAVVHAHAPFSMAFAVARQSLLSPCVPSIFSFVGPVPCTAYGTPSTDELSDAVGAFAKDHNAMLMANHGSVTAGVNLQDAYFKTERLELLCKITLLSRMLGGEVNFTPEEIKKLDEKLERQKKEGLA